MSTLRPGRRTFAILAIVLLVVVAGSDFFIAGFWLGHPMITAIASALVVVAQDPAARVVGSSYRQARRGRPNLSLRPGCRTLIRLGFGYRAPTDEWPACLNRWAASLRRGALALGG